MCLYLDFIKIKIYFVQLAIATVWDLLIRSVARPTASATAPKTRTADVATSASLDTGTFLIVRSDKLLS